MSKGHVFLFTYETTDHLDNVVGSAEVMVKYSFRPGQPARIHWDEHDHPEEPPEIEIDDVVIESFLDAGRTTVWRTATHDEFERYSECATDRYFKDMVEQALKDTQAARDEAMEARER